ncbi:glycoside hydrolase family 16 protein [Microlunatus speluncae]|uniref:glycoside hydrolase family 16 protein n=1 Tax=Microlunatus speluncae TaxID=2594267 RepID=UPI0012668308|nr:glycoside hydrolase family 16 protein [Microlunatus speluncae]
MLNEERVWTETFEGQEGRPPNSSIWTRELGRGGMHQDQRYTDAIGNAAHTGDGQLAITARREPDGTITSAKLITQRKFLMRYGHVEARIKVPGGRGTWPAFWMLGENLPDVGWPDCGEIDVMEHVGGDPHTVHGTLHGPGYSGLEDGIGESYDTGIDLSHDFHRYAVRWTANEISWWFNDHPYLRLSPGDVPGPWPFDQPFFLLLNVAVGGDWPGNADGSPDLPATMLVDWITVRA